MRLALLGDDGPTGAELFYAYIQRPALKRSAFPSFNPSSGAAIADFLYAIVVVAAGIWTGALAASLTYRSFLECRGESGVVVCELRKVYPGGLTSTDRFQLNSAAVEPRRFSLHKDPRSRSYELLVLNSELELPSSRDDPDDLAPRLNELLDGKASATGSIHLIDPSFGAAVPLACLAVLLVAKGALMLRVILRERRLSPARN